MYEVKVEALKRAQNAAFTVIDGVIAGAMDHKQANAVTGAANSIIRGVSNDVKARLSMPAMIKAEKEAAELSK